MRAYRAFVHYAMTVRSFEQTARAMGVWRSTIYTWARKYRWRERLIEMEQRLQESVQALRMQYVLRLTPLAAQNIESMLRDDSTPPQVRASLALDVLRGLGIMRSEQTIEWRSPTAEQNPLVQALRAIKAQVDAHDPRMEPTPAEPVETSALPADGVPAPSRPSGDSVSS